MTKRTRRVAQFAAALFLSALLFSLAFLIVQADHDCIGEHCPVCCEINLRKDAFRQIAFGAAATALAVVMTFGTAKAASSVRGADAPITLITLKVKLTN